MIVRTETDQSEGGMDVDKMLAELREERKHLDEVIIILERLALGACRNEIARGHRCRQEFRLAEASPRSFWI